MKHRPFLLLLILAIPSLAIAQNDVRFEDYFFDKTMRIDYFHIGNAGEEIITIDQLHQQGIWAGSRRNLIDPFNNGRYSVKIYDDASGNLIYSKGFDSYFGEYKTTDVALGEKKGPTMNRLSSRIPKRNSYFL